MYTQLPVDTAASSKILDAPPEVKNLSILVYLAEIFFDYNPQMFPFVTAVRDPKFWT